MSFKEVLKTISNISKEYLTDKPYIVGGLPRDIYLKIPNIKTSDIDITTNSADVMRLGILVADKLNVTFDLSEDSHVTVFSDEFDIDFSSHFVSSKVKESIDAKFKGLEETFSRDFTINTLHQDLDTFEILDPTEQGFEDIKNKVIKTPVNPEITLTDDPRRVYRAIELATRYNFNISDDIKKFAIENPNVFSPELIKDKYISVKINKALKNNEELTLKLLNEMNLFSNVPLSGYFKDVLIGRKILIDYLDGKKMNKKSFIANNWEEYISQGPAYQAVKDFWENNYSTLGGNNNSYHNWTSWYNNNYKKWREHKSPEETLEVMKQQSIPQETLSQQFISNISESIKKRKKDFFNLFQNKDDEDEVKIKTKHGVDIENIDSVLKDFLNELFLLAEKLNYKKPIVTSGYRSIEEQAAIMGKNWKNNGGINGGREYLIRIYGNTYGNQMADIFETYGHKAIDKAITVIKSRPIGSSHILFPSQAVDIAATDGILELLTQIKNSGKFPISIKDETNTAGPHYHVSLKSKIASRINSRNQLLINFK